MKTKYLLTFLGVVSTLLIYFLLCNHFLNDIILDNTKNTVQSYVDSVCADCEWKYLTAVFNDKNSFKVIIETKKDNKSNYYQLYFSYDYRFISCEEGKPSYV